jgi:hypothetical protein
VAARRVGHQTQYHAGSRTPADEQVLKDEEVETRRVLVDGEAARVLDHLEGRPPSSELVSTSHVKNYGMVSISLAAFMCPYCSFSAASRPKPLK